MSAYERDRMKFVTSRGRRVDERAHEQKADSLVTPWCSVEGRQVIEDYERYKEYRTRFYARYDPVEDPWAPDGEVIFIPVPLPSDLEPPLDIPHNESKKKIGLNALKTFYYVPGSGGPTKYGDTESQFNDCADLGVKVIRQFGLADLLWGMLAGRNAEVPLEPGLAAVINDPNNVRRVAELFAEAHRTHTKVIFTFLTLGGGADAIRSPFVQDPIGKMESVLQLNWSEDHLSAQVNGYPFNYFTRGRSISVKNWLLNTLDIRSGYKRYYFVLIAKHAAALLLKGLDEAKNTFDLDAAVKLRDVIEGIEIFNEIDTRSRIYKPSGEADIAEQAYWWALAYVECAEAFYLGLSGEIPILLPGLSSYLPESGFKWPEKLQFLDSFLYQVDTEASTRGLSTHSIASGIDYHWYHRKSGQELHIGYLIHEVDEIQSLLDKYISTECAITIMETGVAVRNDFAPRVKRRKTSKTGPFVDDLVDLEGYLFQSNEIWRRLGGVLASGATGAGWHSWMSGFPEDFELMGLRYDGSDRKYLPAKEADTRWSWFSFARLSTVLGEVYAGQMILPVISSRSDLLAMSKADGLVVLEFTLSSSLSMLQQFAYLVFYDPTGAANGATVEVSSTFSVVHASLVSTRINGPPTSTGGSQINLPTGLATFDPDALLTLPTVLTVYKEDSPLLILSDRRLQWANVDAFETAKR